MRHILKQSINELDLNIEGVNAYESKLEKKTSSYFHGWKLTFYVDRALQVCLK